MPLLTRTNRRSMLRLKLRPETVNGTVTVPATESSPTGGADTCPLVAFPNFTSAPGAMTPTQFVGVFAAEMHNPVVYREWIDAGIDLRRLNPGGAYLKHINLRTIDSTQREPRMRH